MGRKCANGAAEGGLVRVVAAVDTIRSYCYPMLDARFSLPIEYHGHTLPFGVLCERRNLVTVETQRKDSRRIGALNHTDEVAEQRRGPSERPQHDPFRYKSQNNTQLGHGQLSVQAGQDSTGRDDTGGEDYKYKFQGRSARSRRCP